MWRDEVRSVARRAKRPRSASTSRTCTFSDCDDLRRIAAVANTIDRDSSQALWRSACTFEELCDLAARFVEGELTSFPGWLAPTLDVESDAITVHLARLCRAGFLTLASQPGRGEHPAHDGTPCVQRAFVTGFVSAELARSIALCIEESALEIEVLVFSEGAAEHEVSVSTRDGVPYAFTGRDATADEIDCFEDSISSDALAALRDACYVAVVDPIWGREDVLWRELERVVIGDDG